MNLDIKKVTIGKLKFVNKTGIIQNGCSVYNMEREDIETKICIINEEYAIDINDFTLKYPIVKRNNCDQILPEQEIIEDTLYALSLKDIEKDDLKELKQTKYKKRYNDYIKNSSRGR